MALNYQTNDPSSGSGFNWGSLVSPTIGAVGSYVGGQQSKNAIDAANAQQNAIYGQVAGIYQPQYATGMGADKSLASALGLNGAAPNYAAFENSPGYQFTLQQGDQAINRAAAASGNAFSSSTLAALDKYNTGLAQQNYQNYVGNLLSTAGLGNQAAAGMSAARLSTGANIAQGMNNIGGINQSGVNSAVSQFAGPLGNLAKSYFSGGGTAGAVGGGTAGAVGDVTAGSYGAATAADGTPYFLADSSGATDALASTGVPNWLSGFSAAGGEAAGGAGVGAAGAGADVAAGADAAAGAGAGASALGTIGAVAPYALALAAIGYGASRIAGNPGAQEAQPWQNFVSAYNKSPSTATLNPASAYQDLASVMSAENNSPGHSQPIEQVFGRMGEQNLMQQMTQHINSQIAAGRIPRTATPQQIYSQVVAPWLASKNAGIANQYTSNGQAEAPALQADLTSLIGYWQSGLLSAGSKVGSGGQTIAGLQAFGG